MTREQYERWSAPFRSPGGERGMNLTNLILTRLCYVAYPLCLIWLGTTHDGRLLPALAVPAVTFLAVSVFRNLYNAQRPYELLEIKPLIHKDKRGKSFPSRHVFSVFIIAMTFLWLLPAVGAAFLLIGILLACCRVIGGVHFPRDVLAGALMGILSGLVGYWVIF